MMRLFWYSSMNTATLLRRISGSTYDVAALKSVGCRCEMPGGTYFLYAKAPSAAGERRFANAEEASQYLIHEQSVCCVPWDDAGPYLRFSVTYLAKDEAEEDALMAETVERLGRLKPEF